VNDLLAQIRFRNGVTAKNRVALAPMTNSQSHDDGTLGDDELKWLEARADGGFGIVISCASHVTKDGQGWKGELGSWSDTQVPGLTRLATSMKARGALPMVQLFHGGLRADATLTGERPWSASEAEGGPRAATEADLARVIAAFADGAARAHAAGMSGVEIHGAHGYLLTQFLSAVENRRTDAWGGSLENRARLVREVTRAVRAKVPASFLVGVRISPEDWGNAKGLDLDESLQVARWLAEDGVDFLHLSLWTASRPTKKRPDAHPLPLFRAAVPAEVALFVAGKIWTREEADSLLALGADVIALGRSAIANPDWPLRVADRAWKPKEPPLTREELRARGLSERFVGYMTAWKGFVAE
jgi:2,4-dienoyl-CoA reductase-like NADH-dependent reductase (Old Yellow Enzyme family)